MNRSIVAVVAALAMSVQGCSMLGGGPPRSAEGGPQGDAQRQAESNRLARFDENADGSIQRAEMEDTLKADFKKDDLNNNQVLDPNEARALNERLRDEPGTSPVFDWNADGRLVYAEFATQWRTMFDRADRNSDGVVDADELKSLGRERKMRELPKPTFSGKDGRPPGSP